MPSNACVEESGTTRFCAIFSLPVDRMFFKAYICFHAIGKSLRLVKRRLFASPHTNDLVFLAFMCLFVLPQLELRNFLCFDASYCSSGTKSEEEGKRFEKDAREKITLNIVLKYSRLENALRYYHIFLPKFLCAYHRGFSCDLE